MHSILNRGWAVDETIDLDQIAARGGQPAALGPDDGAFTEPKDMLTFEPEPASKDDSILPGGF